MSGILLLRRRLFQERCLSSRFNQIRHYALIGKPSKNQKPAWALPDSPVRTRFAPSPTGYLHLGSLRTALFNYLLAQATGGQFIIRLEDTDQTRFVKDSEQRLYQDLKWAGLSWDEGPDIGGPFGPYKQSDRLDLYRQHASMLLDRGHAFRCFCSKEDLEFNLKQSTSSGAAAHYPGTCTVISKSESDRRAANGEPHIIRFKTSETPVAALDLVYGAYKKAEREDDFIIMKSDGFPTYHFANVVDDHFMEITHVIRGAEWLISTPKHVELYNAFGWRPPNFAHVGLLVDHQRQKLSKRDIDNIGISVFRDTNILPEALMNFSVLLGWDPGLQNKPHLDKRGRLTMDEMKENFSLKFTRGDIVVDLVKLKYFQNRFIRDLISGSVADPATLSNRILKPMQAELQRLDESFQVQQETEEPMSGLGELDSLGNLTMRRPHSRTEDYIHQVLKAWKGPVDDHSQFIRDNMYAFWAPSKAAYKDSYQNLQDGMRRITLTRSRNAVENTDISRVLTYFRSCLDDIPEDQWVSETVGDTAKKLADAVEYYDIEKQQAMDHGAGWKFLRWGLFNGMSGLSVVPMMLLLGREESLRRLREARKIAARSEEKAAAAELQRQSELKRSGVRIAYLAGPRRDEAKGGPGVELLEPRNVKVPIKQARPEENPTQTENFLRAMHKPLQEPGPFVSRVPDRVYAHDGKPPINFLEREVYKTGFRHLLDDVDKDKSPYAPPLWEVIEKRKQAAEERSQEAIPEPSQPEGVGPLRPPGQDFTQYERAEHRFHPDTPGPMLKPMHPAEGKARRDGPPAHRGPYLVGKPIVDLRSHIAHVRVLNIDKAIQGNKGLRRDRAKRTRSDSRKVSSRKPRRDVRESGKGPYWVGPFGSHLTNPLPQNVLAHARAAEDEWRVRNDLKKEENVSIDDAEKKLQRSWVERNIP